MANKLRAWLTPPVFKDEEQSRVGRILHVILTTLLIGDAMACVIYVSVGNHATATALIVGGATVLGALGLARRGHLRLSGIVVLVALLSMTTYLLIISGGIHGITIILYPVIIIVASLLLGHRGFVAITLLSIMSAGGIVIAEMTGVIQTKYAEATTLDDFVIVLIILIVTAIAIRLLANNLTQSLARARRELAERLHAEEALRQSEGRFRSLVQNSTDIITLHDAEGVTLYETPSAARILGYGPGGLIGKNPMQFVHPDDIPAVQQALAEVVQKTNPGIPTEYRFCRADGSWAHLESVASNLLDHPSIRGIVLTSRDITERKRVEAALRESEQHFRTFIEQASDGVALVDEQGLIQEWNQALERITGLKRAEVLGMPFWDVQFRLMLPERRSAARLAAMRTTLLDWLRTGQSPLLQQPLEAVIVTPEGQTRFIQQTMFLITTDAGNRVGSIVSDITERKQADREIQSLARFPGENPYPVLRVTQDGILLYANSSSRLLQQLWNIDVSQLLPDDWRTRVSETFASGASREEEVTCGNIVYSLILTPIAGTNYLNIYGRDITERKQAEAALRESEERLLRLADAAFEGLGIHEQGRIIEANEQLARMFGYTLDEMIGRPVMDFVAPESRPLVMEQIRTPGEKPYDHLAQKKDGAVFSVEVQGRSLPYHGRPVRVTAIRDITERKRAEEALRQSTERLATLHEIDQAILAAKSIEEIAHAALTRIQRIVPSRGAHVVLFEDGEAVLVASYVDGRLSPTGERIERDALGLPESFAQGQAHVVDDLLDVASPAPMEQYMRDHGMRAYIKTPLVVLGKVIGYLTLDSRAPAAFRGEAIEIIREVTDQLAVAIQNTRLLDQTRRHTEELEQRVVERTRELAEANLRLTELDQLKSKFVSDVSHELRTPIANLKLYVELLQRGSAEKRAHYLTVLKQQAGRLTQLVEDILNLSRLELGGGRVTFGPVNLNYIVDQVVTAHQPRAEATGLTLTFAPGLDLPPVRGEVNQLAQVVTNLVGNALSYTLAGHVYVLTRLDNGQACLQVEDTGIGIDPDDLPHLFDRFYRGKRPAQVDIPGTGLGLAIVKEIVELHQGRIAVESRLGQGSTFRIWLPLHT